MNFEPNKLFIGLVDFFSILLPGALFTFVTGGWLGSWFLGDAYDSLGETERWGAFLFASYLFGHFIFLLGSWVLDDVVYDRLRNGSPQQMVRRLAKGKVASPAWARLLARFMVKEKDHDDAAVELAGRLKEKSLGVLGDPDVINAFQWSKARLTQQCPAALEGVTRLEADSKFFRSLVIVLLLVAPWSFAQQRTAAGLVALVCVALAFWRYVNLRLKSTNQAYWQVITLEAQAGTRLEQKTVSDTASHAGGVVFRKRGEETKFLLVSDSRSREEWLLPKGHVEPGETCEQAAVREVAEEAGVWGRVRNALGEKSFITPEGQVNVRWFLMEHAGHAAASEKREVKWLTEEDAISQATFDETKELIRLAAAAVPLLSRSISHSKSTATSPKP